MRAERVVLAIVLTVVIVILAILKYRAAHARRNEGRETIQQTWNTQKEKNIWTTVEARQRRRKAQLEKVCRDMRSYSDICNTTYTQLLLDPIHKLLIAPIPDSGSNAILLGSVLTRNELRRNAKTFISSFVQPFLQSSTFMESTGAATHIRFLPYPTFHRAREEQTTMNKTFGTFFKILFVRNPLVRVISSFYRQEGNSALRNGTDSASFENFLNRIIKSSSEPCSTKKFWLSYQDVEPCRIPWDFIGHMETFEEDFGYILRRTMNSSFDVHELFSTLEGGPEGAVDGVDVTSQIVTWLDQMSPNEIGDYFWQVAPGTLQKFMEIVDFDSRMFGYEARTGWTP